MRQLNEGVHRKTKLKMVLFHFIFELIKISILSCIYATMILIAFKIIGHYKIESWFNKVSKRKLRLWFLSGLFISIGLFFYMFSYSGNHGLGDSARIPVGHGRAIEQSDGILAYIQNEGPIDMLTIDKFIITDNYIYGSVGDRNENYEGQYFLYDLINNNVKTYTQEADFINHLKTINQPPRPDYKDFYYYYDKHWSGWRFWLLP